MGGRLVCEVSGSAYTLCAVTPVKREAAWALAFSGDRRVSGDHAELFWTGTQWMVEHRGRAPTLLNGRPLPRTIAEPLRRGDVLVFGTEALGRWVVADDGPPVVHARHRETGQTVTPDGDDLALDGPVVHRRDGAWQHGERPLLDGDVVGPWRISLPGVDSTTQVLDEPVARPTLAAGLSGGDRCWVEIRSGRHVVRHTSKNHLVTWLLARAMREDADDDPRTRGWRDIDTLACHIGGRSESARERARNYLPTMTGRVNKVLAALADWSALGAPLPIERDSGIYRLTYPPDAVEVVD